MVLSVAVGCSAIICILGDTCNVYREEGALQEQNVRLLLYVVNTLSLIGVSFFNFQLFL